MRNIHKRNQVWKIKRHKCMLKLYTIRNQEVKDLQCVITLEQIIKWDYDEKENQSYI